MEVNRVRYKQSLAYGVGSFGQSLIFTIVTLYFMFYLTEYHYLSGTIIGVCFLIFRCWDGLTDPVMGAIVCKTNFKYGKYKTWIAIGAVSSAVVLVLMFTNVNLSYTGKHIYYMLLYFIFGITFTMVDIPYWSLIPAATPIEEDRGLMTSFSQIFSNLGTVLVSVLVPILLAKNDTPSLFLYLSIVISAIYLVCMFVTNFFIKENKNYKSDIIKIKDIFSAFKKNDQAIALFWPMLLMSTAFNSTISLGLYFFTYDIGDVSKFSIFMIIAGSAMFISILTYPFITKRYGRKSVFIFSCVLTIIGYNLMFSANMLFHGNVYLLSGLAVIALFGFGWLMVAKYLMTARVCDYSEEKIGARLESIWTSITSLSGKFSSAIVALSTGVLLDVTSINASTGPGSVTETSLLILRIMMFILPIILIGFTLLLYLSKYKLDNPNVILESDIEYGKYSNHAKIKKKILKKNKSAASNESASQTSIKGNKTDLQKTKNTSAISTKIVPSKKPDKTTDIKTAVVDSSLSSKKTTTENNTSLSSIKTKNTTTKTTKKTSTKNNNI